MTNREDDRPAGEQDRRTWLTPRRKQALGSAATTFGVLAGVAQLVGSSARVLGVTGVICISVVVVAVLLLRGRRPTRLPWGVLVLILLVAVALGAGGMKAFQEWREPDGPLPVCAGDFRPEVRTAPAADAFDVVASFDCVARDEGHPWVTVRVSEVGEHKTTNFYPLRDFTGRGSPFTFHSKPAKTDYPRCYLVVVFPAGVTPVEEYIEELPAAAYEASDCVPSP
jgi:hypothetical protein